jgi:predicted metal-binding membrane protein
VRRGLQLALTAAALVAVAAICWLFLVESEATMGTTLMRRMMTPGEPGPYLVAAASMWIVMMIAMMIPAVLPMVAVYRQVDRSPSPGTDAFVFASGYLAGWTAYAVVAAGVQWWLHARGLLHGMMLVGAAPLAATLLIAAGVYQLTPLKNACLARCRSPLGFVLAHWRDGRLGAFVMGLHHGLFCVGCCWMLMALMFVGGAMSVATMGVLCVFILAERLLPAGPWVATLPGLAMIGWGVALLVWPGCC